jgi:hypothetical protein
MHHQYGYWNLVHTLQNCAMHCEYMINYLRHTPDRCSRSHQMRMLRDCADMCAFTAKFIARQSPFAKHLAHVCAMVCETCARVCLSFPDPASQQCAKVCLHCAQECRQFAGY